MKIMWQSTTSKQTNGDSKIKAGIIFVQKVASMRFLTIPNTWYCIYNVWKPKNEQKLNEFQARTATKHSRLIRYLFILKIYLFKCRIVWKPWRRHKNTCWLTLSYLATSFPVIPDTPWYTCGRPVPNSTAETTTGLNGTLQSTLLLCRLIESLFLTFNLMYKYKYINTINNFQRLLKELMIR